MCKNTHFGICPTTLVQFQVGKTPSGAKFFLSWELLLSAAVFFNRGKYSEPSRYVYVSRYLAVSGLMSASSQFVASSCLQHSESSPVHAFHYSPHMVNRYKYKCTQRPHLQGSILRPAHTQNMQLLYIGHFIIHSRSYKITKISFKMRKISLARGPRLKMRHKPPHP